jgi:hypothetical protein
MIHKWWFIQILYFRTLSTILFSIKNITFWKLDSVSASISLEIGTSSIDWTQLSRFYRNTETKSSLQNIAFLNKEKERYLDKNRMMNNFQKHNIFINVSSSQTFRPDGLLFNLLRMGLLKPNLALRQNLKWQFQILTEQDYKKNTYYHCLFMNLNKIKIIKYRNKCITLWKSIIIFWLNFIDLVVPDLLLVWNERLVAKWQTLQQEYLYKNLPLMCDHVIPPVLSLIPHHP